MEICEIDQKKRIKRLFFMQMLLQKSSMCKTKNNNKGTIIRTTTTTRTLMTNTKHMKVEAICKISLFIANQTTSKIVRNLVTSCKTSNDIHAYQYEVGVVVLVSKPIS